MAARPPPQGHQRLTTSFPHPVLRVDSSDGVSVAVRDFGAAPAAPPLLISHATGFRTHCYCPVAAQLSARFRVWGLDHRGHGDTPPPGGQQVEWSRFGDDTLADCWGSVIRWAAPPF